MSATQKFFRNLFGVGGSRAAVPDVSQGDGSISYQDGYGPAYALANTDPSVKKIERDKFNQLMYDLTLGLHQYQTIGFPEFIAAADNGGVNFSYSRNAYVRWTDGNVYVSLVDANTADPSDATKWIAAPVGGNVGSVQMFPATTAPAGFVKANGTTLARASYPQLWAYAQASNNLAVSDGAWSNGQWSPGDGSTTFRVPDLRGVHFRALDDSRGVDTGRVIGSRQANQQPSHTHTYGGTTSTQAAVAQYLGYTSGGGTPGVPGITQGVPTINPTSVAQLGLVSDIPAHSHTYAGTTAATGTGAEVRVENIALLACIRYQ